MFETALHILLIVVAVVIAGIISRVGFRWFKRIAADLDLTASHYKLIIFVGLIVLCFAAAGMAIGRTIPVNRRVHVTTTREIIDRHVEKISRVFVPVPTNVAYKPLVGREAAHEACTGAPVVIEKLHVQNSGTDDKPAWNTFFVVRPAGDEYRVVCQKAGDYSAIWHEGDLVAIFGAIDG